MLRHLQGHTLFRQRLPIAAVLSQHLAQRAWCGFHKEFRFSTVRSSPFQLPEIQAGFRQFPIGGVKISGNHILTQRGRVVQSHPDDPHTGVSAAAQGIGAVVQHLLLRKQRIDTGSAVLRQLCSGEHHGGVNAQRLRLTGQQLFQCVVLILQCAAVQAHHLLQSQRNTGTANCCAGTAHILRRVSTCIGSKDSIRHTLCPQFHRRHMIPLQPFQNGIADGIWSGGNANAGELSGAQKGLCCFQQCCLIRRLYRCKAAPEKGDFRFFQRCAAF